ncbi:MAG: hypothetical protein IJW60_01625 [Clostridia bacterium]|nr:hypothetical protein [Clostridia bacterium]
MKKQMIKIAAVIAVFSSILFAGCASCDREWKSCNSNVNGGLNRVVNVYTHNGELIATYEGLIDIDDNDNGSIMFDLDGKRYVYYNAIVEVIEK